MSTYIIKSVIYVNITHQINYWQFFFLHAEFVSINIEQSQLTIIIV